MAGNAREAAHVVKLNPDFHPTLAGLNVRRIMRIKHAIITALITWALVIGVGVGVAVYRHDVSVKSLLEYVWGVSFAAAVLGFLFRSGAVTGDTVERTEGVVKSSQNREGFIRADNDDAILGFAFGTVVMISGLLLFGVSLAILYVFFFQ